MCSVGDLKNNLRILQSEARQMKFSGDFDIDGLSKGNPHALLPLYNHMFANYNAQFSTKVMEILDDNLYMKSDVRFMEAVYKILRDLFHYKPPMTKEQFFTMNNFAERKIMMCVEVMRLIQQYCRFLGPKNPTNPNIKVSSVVDTRRCNKKSSTDLVTSEPSSVSDPSLSRKVSEKHRPKPAIGISDEGWQLRTGYLRPRGEDHAEDRARDERREKAGREGVEREDGSKKSDKPNVMTNVVREFTPMVARTERGKAAEVVHMPPGKYENGHLRVADMMGRPQSQAAADWDPTGAVECILAKVRDLPAQLTSFMKAVEGRLQKIEERLDKVETATTRLVDSDKKSETKADIPNDVRHEIDTLQARLLLLENRVTISENKVPCLSSEGPKSLPVMEEKKTEFTSSSFTPGSFVSLERGEDIFSGSLMSTFSPIRQDIGDFNPLTNDTLTSLAETDNRRSSTPNHSCSGKPPTPNHSYSGKPPIPSHSCSGKPPTAKHHKQDDEKRQAASADTSITFQTLDTSIQQQVERINDLFKATHRLLPASAEPPKPDT